MSNKVSDKTNLVVAFSLPVKIGVFGLAGILRLFSAFYLAPFLFNSREFVTPWNSFKRIQEAVYLLSVGIDAHEGDLFHLMPMYIYIFRILTHEFWLCFIVYTLCDLITGYCLKRFAFNYLVSIQGAHSNYAEHFSDIVAVLYLFNPMTIGSCSVFSLSSIANFLLAIFANLVIRKHVCLSTILLIFISSIYPYYFILLAVLFLAFPSVIQRTTVVIVTLFTILALFFINQSLNSTSSFFQNTFGFFMAVPDLTPNVGAFWYFFVQIFDHYREFFRWIFQLNMLIYIVPLSVTLRKDPYVTMLLLLIQISMFSSYPSYAEAVVYLALIPAFSHLHQHIRHKLIIFGCFCATLVLTPIMWRLWVVTGSGNANFYFAINFVYTIAQVFLMSDLMHSYLRNQLVEKCREKGIADINEKTKKFSLEFRPF
uniref:Phosphatidylinositol glycan anchor biosynthesis class U protein n=1 Tax=Acrobeloides nanus TaxID=290746 RepID=A0A914DJE6_9BILA